jgi:antitoxin component YwqK of YwqJK toxin-antitoxin module
MSVPVRSLILFLSIVGLQLQVSAQSFELFKGDTINKKDAAGMKQGRWLVFNKDGKHVGYGENQLVEEGRYADNKKTGVWLKFWPNGQKKHEITFANNIASGFAKFYYKSGNLQEEGMWESNKWVGEYRYYFENGNKQYEWKYNASGKREGEQVYYHENGKPLYIGTWANGNEQGELVEYYDDGSVHARRYFNAGKIDPAKTVDLVKGKENEGRAAKYSGVVQKVQAESKQMGHGQIVDGYNKLLNADGTVSKEGIFKSKKLIDGKVYHYEGGKLVSTEEYKGGVSLSAPPAKK